jgi:hypothetical protein
VTDNLFVHIPKTGGTSLRDSLGYSIPVDYDQHDLIKNYPTDILDAATYRFTVVRNPLERLVSWFYYIKPFEFKQFSSLPETPENEHLRKYTQHAEFTDWFDVGAENHWPFTPWRMLDWITDDEGTVIVDDVFFLRDLCRKDSKQWASLKDRAGVSNSLPFFHLNGSKHRPYLEYYTPERKQKAMDMCADDIAHFKFPGLY